MDLSKLDKNAISLKISEECKDAISIAEHLLRAPEACCMIETLAVIANCTNDPSLKSGDPNEIFKYLRTPGSFKASLYQVINAMCNAFRTAHNSMDKIHGSLKIMPQLMNDSLKAMDHLNEEGSQNIIDYSLHAITRSANTCVKAAQEADKKCKDALEVIEELLQAALATRGRSEHRNEAAKIELQEQERLKIQKNEFIKEMEERIADQKQVVQDAMDDYKLRMSQSTDFSGVVGAMFLDNLNTLITSVGKTAENIGAIAGSLPAGVVKAIKTEMDSSKTRFSKDDLIGQAMEGVLYELMEIVIKSTNENVIAQAESHIKNLSSANKYITASKSGQMLRKTSQALIDALHNLQQNGLENGENDFETAKTAAALNLKVYDKVGEQASELAAAGVGHDGINTHRMTSEERQTLMRTRLDNLKISRENLAVEKKLQESLRKERTEAQEKLCQIMTNMERLKIEEVDLKDVVHYLRLGIQELSKVQVAWGNIVAFFSHIKNSVDGPLMDHIESMTTNVKKISDKNISNISEFQRGIILREITNACVVANVLMESAKIYMTISENYVKPILDKSIINMSLTQDAAKYKQREIVSNFHDITSAVEKTVEEHSQTIKYKVYGALQDQGFYVGRFIEDKKMDHQLKLELHRD